MVTGAEAVVTQLPAKEAGRGRKSPWGLLDLRLWPPDCGRMSFRYFRPSGSPRRVTRPVSSSPCSLRLSLQPPTPRQPPRLDSARHEPSLAPLHPPTPAPTPSPHVTDSGGSLGPQRGNPNWHCPKRAGGGGELGWVSLAAMSSS